MAASQTQSVNYDSLVRRLAVRACLIMGLSSSLADTRVIEGIGKSASDFAVDTLVLYLSGEVQCSSDEDALAAYLGRVMERDIIDARRSHAVKTTQKVEHLSDTTSPDGERLAGLDDYAGDTDFSDTIEGRQFKERLYAHLEGSEPELHELAYAVCDVNAKTPKEIAAVIGTTPEDIYNRKKRFRTFITKTNLMDVPTSRKPA